MIANKSSIRFGVNSSYPGLMIDQDGNTYKTQESAGWYDYPVTEGVYMNMPVTKTWFADVKKSAKTIQQVADRHQCKLRRDWTDNTEECPDTMGCGTIGILYSVSDAGITSLD